MAGEVFSRVFGFGFRLQNKDSSLLELNTGMKASQEKMAACSPTNYTDGFYETELQAYEDVPFIARTITEMKIDDFSDLYTYLPSDPFQMDIEPCNSDNCTDLQSPSAPHEGFKFALEYLGFRDLMAVETVCKDLKFCAREDPLLWRCIHIDSRISHKVTDEKLVELVKKTRGELRCLNMIGCSYITDEGLLSVLEICPNLAKLNVAVCLRITLNGLKNALNVHRSIKQLRLGRFFSVTENDYEELNQLLGIPDRNKTKEGNPRYFHLKEYESCCNYENALDVEKCPMCGLYRVVYDCPMETCRENNCRGCRACILRCTQCGKCIKEEDKEETFSLESVCLGCYETHN